MAQTAKLILDGREVELPVVVGSEGEKALDISQLRAHTGYITIDAGYKNTSCTTSQITYLDGESGILRYRGYPIEQLADKCTFLEVTYLLVYGALPSQPELDTFSDKLFRHSFLHEGMRQLFNGFPATGHPMGVLAAMAGSLSAYYPQSLKVDADTDTHITNALAKIRTIAAFGYKRSIGQPVVYPRNDLTFSANILHMLFAVPAEPYEPDPVHVQALNTLLILHADNGQNCSTSAVRFVGSSDANLYTVISAGISALWGPLHGGANQGVMEMLRCIRDSGGDYKGFMASVKNNKTTGRRLMGFGHRVYKNYDPRAKILKALADRLLSRIGVVDPLLDIAKNLEEIALTDDYFVERKLFPNMDFYSGIAYRAIGIPENMFTVLFALGRLPGWIAQWREMKEDPNRVISRPRQIYMGETMRNHVAIADRK